MKVDGGGVALYGRVDQHRCTATAEVVWFADVAVICMAITFIIHVSFNTAIGASQPKLVLYSNVVFLNILQLFLGEFSVSHSIVFRHMDWSFQIMADITIHCIVQHGVDCRYCLHESCPFVLIEVDVEFKVRIKPLLDKADIAFVHVVDHFQSLYFG